MRGYTILVQSAVLLNVMLMASMHFIFVPKMLISVFHVKNYVGFGGYFKLHTIIGNLTRELYIGIYSYVIRLKSDIL